MTSKRTDCCPKRTNAPWGVIINHGDDDGSQTNGRAGFLGAVRATYGGGSRATPSMSPHWHDLMPWEAGPFFHGPDGTRAEPPLVPRSRSRRSGAPDADLAPGPAHGG